MKKLIFTISILLTFLQTISSQEIIEKKFLKNKYGELSKEKKAKYIKLTIKEVDGTLNYETRKLKNNELVRFESYKNGAPVGKWLTLHGKQLDYSFDLLYNEKEYENIVHFDLAKKVVTGEVEGVFEVPKFTQSENNFRKYISLNIKYPEPCLENGIQGKVISQFVIDEEGKITEYSILKSADKILDKEAARVILESPNWIPARLNGAPIKVHIILPNNFIMQ